MKQLEAGQTRTENCTECGGSGWILKDEDYPPLHYLRTKLNAETIARSRPCPYRDHGEDCVLVASPQKHTVAYPCPTCKPDWVHPDRRTEKPPEKEPKEKQAEAKKVDQAQWWMG